MRTIKNFLVGLGYDYDKKGESEIGSGIDSLKGKALQLGAVVAGAFGIKSLTADFAASNDMLGKFSKTLDVDASTVAAFGRALEHEGGSLAGFMGQLENIERMRAGLQVGDAGWLAAAGAAQIDTSQLIDATNATEAYLALADQFAAMTSQQRLNAAEALGLDMPAIRLLSQGRDTVAALVQQERDMRPVLADMTAESARFNDEWQNAWTNIGAVADRISMLLLPTINDVLESTNDLFDSSRVGIFSVVSGDIFRAGEEEKTRDVTGFTPGKWWYTPAQDFTRESFESLGDDFIRLVSHIYDTLGAGFGPDSPAVSQAGGDRTGPEILLQSQYFPDTNAADVVQPIMLMQPAPAPTVTPSAPTLPPISIDMPVILDGQVIERKIRSVNEQIDRDAFDNIKSPVEG